jgi:DNA-binding winged helix-turn-helix (wHTH) protein/tetratricopeptide (TPR) repeat protein
LHSGPEVHDGRHSGMKEFPPFRLDTINECLWRRRDGGNDEQIRLAPKAFAVLRYLVEHAGRPVTQNELLETLWSDTFVQPDVLKTHILDVRSALGDHPKNPQFIETLPRKGGYRFIAHIEDASALPTSGFEPPSRRLVGRKVALDQLSKCLQIALRSQRQVVFVTGEPGIGKTALVDEFQRNLASEVVGLRIARGQCVEGYGGKEAYYPLLEALGQLCRGPEKDSLVQILEREAPTLLVQFPALVRRDHRETLKREILGATRDRMLREISEAMETIASGRPLLVILEDLHWVDHSTVDLISALARRRPPAKLMLIGTYRTGDVARSDHPLKTLKWELLIHELCHEIALDPLEEAGVAEYLDAESGGTAVPEGLTGLIYRQTEGNPLFMVAILKHMRERELVADENGGLTLSVPLQEIALRAPHSLQQMIESQIERLSEDARQALESASVVGVLFSAAVTAIAANMNMEDFEHVCEDLSRRHQLVRSVGSQEFPDGTVSGRYEFAHSLYREIFYRRLAPGSRTKLHQRIGERLEEIFAADPGEAASELARHFEESRDWSRAIKYLGLIAETAGRRYALRETAATLWHAVELSRKLPDAERAMSETGLLERLAEIYVISFDDRASAAYEDLASRAAHYGLIDVEARALIGMAYPLSYISSQRCLEVLERVLRLSNQQRDPLVRARTRASCFVRRVWVGGWNPQDAEECKTALAQIQQLGDRLVIATHLIDCSFIQWCSSDYRKARENAVDALATLLDGHEENLYLSFSYWTSQFILPWSLLHLGEWGQALSEIAAGITMAEKNGVRYRTQTLLLYRAWVHLHALDFVGVRAICDVARPSLDDPARRPWHRFCLILAGSAEAALGNHDGALRHLLQARDEMDQQAVIHDWHRRMLLQSALSELWLGLGNLHKARAEAEHFLIVTEATAERTWQALAWEVNARIAMAEGDPTRAQDCIAKALSAIEGFEVPLASWRVRATAGTLYRNSGDRDLSEHHLLLSRDTIMKLANSMLAVEPLRQIFLSSPLVRTILGDNFHNQGRGPESVDPAR